MMQSSSLGNYCCFEQREARLIKRLTTIQKKVWQCWCSYYN